MLCEVSLKGEEDKCIVVGNVGRPYGVRGWVRINSYTEPAHNILDYQPWELRQFSQTKQVALRGSRVSVKSLLVHFESVDTPEQARMLTNAQVIIRREQLPALNQGEYYWSDLVGLTVTTLHGDCLGRVDHLFATGSNDVLVIKGEKKHLLPFLVDQVIRDIDFEKKMITVDWDADF